MASYTTNLNLEMPTVNEKYDVLKQNANWQKVDDYAGTVNEQITTGRVAMSTTEYFQLAYDFSHRITKDVMHICCRLKVLSLPSSSDVNAIFLPNGVTFDRYGMVIPVYKSSGEWSTPNTIVYCYVGTNVLVVHKDDLAVGNYIYLDYTARVNS